MLCKIYNRIERNLNRINIIYLLLLFIYSLTQFKNKLIFNLYIKNLNKYNYLSKI